MEALIKGLVTVVVTAYNLEKYIENCLMSVCGQSYRGLQILVVDDGSGDGTEKICREICEKDPRCTYIRQENQGVSVARNQGIEKARGEYLMFVDGDDALTEKAVENLLARMDADADIICCCCNAFSEEGMQADHFFEGDLRMETEKEKERLFLQLMDPGYGKIKTSTAIGVPWGKIYRTSLIKDGKLRFNPALRRMQDNIFNMHVFARAGVIQYVNEPWYLYRLDHISTVRFKYAPEIWKEIMRERDSFYEAHPDLVTEEVRRFRYLEKNTAMLASVAYIAGRREGREGVREIKSLMDSGVFADVIREWRAYYRPVRFLAVRTLLKLRRYGLTLALMKVYLKRT